MSLMSNRLPTWLLISITGALPTLMLTTHSGGSTAFYGTLLACLLVIAAPSSATGLIPRNDLLVPYKSILFSLVLPIAAICVNIAFVDNAKNSGDLERSLRLALGVPLILAAMLRCAISDLKQALWGFPIAAWISTGVIIYLIYPNLLTRPDTPYFNTVSYGNLMLLIATIIMYSLAIPISRFHGVEITLKIASAITAFTGFILTQTRSGWLAIPIFVYIGLLLHGRIRRPIYALYAMIGVVFTLLAIGAANPLLRDRATLVYTQSQECLTETANADTSICVRIQLWRSSLEMFRSAPLTGIGGGDSFKKQLAELEEQGKVSKYVASGFGEPHNDFLKTISSYGILGGIGLLLVYGTPAVVFLRRLRSDHAPAIRAAAAMGLATCLGFATFGLTELMFRGMRTVGFYTVLIALFLALSDARLAPPRQNGRT